MIETVLLPVCRAWQADVPDVRLSLLSDNANLRLMHGDADIALRMARPHDENDAVARKLCDDPFVVAGHGDWIGYVQDMAHLPQAQWTAADPEPVGLRVSDVNAAHAAVRLGMGKAWLPQCQTNGLHVADAAPRARPLWCVLHPRSRYAPAVRAVVDHMLPLVMTRLHG